MDKFAFNGLDYVTIKKIGDDDDIEKLSFKITNKNFNSSYFPNYDVHRIYQNIWYYLKLS